MGREDRLRGRRAVVRPRHVLEYVGLRAAVGVLGHLPHSVALRIAAAAGVVLDALGWRRKETRRRVQQVMGPACSVREVARIARRALANFLASLVDALHAPRFSKQWCDLHVRVVGFEHLESARVGGRGVILALPHLGSWELAGLIGPWFGVPLVVLGAPQKNPWFNRWVQRWRERTGTRMISRTDLNVRAVVRGLQAGDVLAIPVDIRSPQGVPVRFLGHPAWLGRGVPSLAILANVSIVPCTVYRTSWTTHCVHLHPPLDPNAVEGPSAERIQRLLQRVVDAIEPDIRAHPDQYFWFNRRWVLDPVRIAEDAPARSPSSVTSDSGPLKQGSPAE